MSRIWLVSFLLFFGLYTLCFIRVDTVYVTDKKTYLNPPVPADVQRIAYPYLTQTVAEVLYVKTVVYLGSTIQHESDIDVEALAQNFEVMQSLHPYLFDTYYVANAYLPREGASYVRRTNMMLEKATGYLEGEWRIPFFIAYNNFFYLKDNQAAYAYLHKATELSGNSFFSHLASVLMVKGGELKVATAWLIAMYDAETDEVKRKFILQDIDAYKAALHVEGAVKAYYSEKNLYPTKLADLIPIYLKNIPNIEANFEIVYDGQGTVKLQRPQLPK